MIFNGVDFERIRSRFRDCSNTLDTLEDELLRIRAAGLAGYDIDTVDREQEALVQCIIELADAAAEELEKLIKDGDNY